MVCPTGRNHSKSNQKSHKMFKHKDIERIFERFLAKGDKNKNNIQ